MASDQEPEVQFAQRLASNEKPVRTRAMKKLRKYISVRSQRGGFSGDELLKLWKGLFYCLWMQDKPLLQEELSKQISSLIHSFQDVDGQFLYLESFLQTFKREWTGIDRLRMDKFFQLVRFMFRQTFEMLKRKNWESSVVSRFLELLTVQVLQSGSGAPSGLQFHILDLYMTELATVGSAELTADQNLIFIEPFCKTAAKTKDRGLFRTICSSIFSAIIDQAPFAIDELMKEVKAASDSDSGQASEGDDGEEQQTASKPVGKKKTGRPINGNKSTEEEEDEEDDDDDDDDDDDELLHLEDSDSEALCDEDIGPVLQFDYSALANKLFELASRSSTPSQNRQRLYKIIKVLRDLSEGIFPQDEYPEEVSTDEDDDMFGSRKRMKRRKPCMEDEDEGEAPASKKSKGKKKEASTPNKQNKDSAQDDAEPADITMNPEDKKKKRKKRKKKKKAAGEGNVEKSEQEQIVDQSSVKEAEAETQSSVSSVKVTEDAAPEGRSEAASVTVSEETSEPTSCAADGGEDQTENNKKEEPAEKKQTRKKNKGLKANSQTNATAAESQVSAEAEINATPETEATTAAKKTKKGLKNLEEVEVNGVSTEEDATAEPEKPVDCTTPGKKKGKKKKSDEAAVVEVKHAEITSVGEEDFTATPLERKTKKKRKQEVATLEASSAATPLKNKSKKNQKDPAEEEDGAVAETPQVDAEELPITVTTPAKKKKKKPVAAQVEEINDQMVGGEDETVSSSGKVAKKKKRKIPVVFEFEADELEAEAAAAINGIAEEKVTTVKKKKLLSDAGEPSTPLSAKKFKRKVKTPAGSAFVTFQSGAAALTPLYCKTKGGRSTPPSRKKKTQTPKSESKKVTFGLKNNKTAEFRKTDRSLLVSPDGSSRVPFDPQQKPKFGVLKSPGTPLSSKLKKTTNGTRKTGPDAPKSTPKRRPSAADFF